MEVNAIGQVIISIGSFLVGMLSGVLIRPIFDKRGITKAFSPEQFVLLTVTLLWALSFILSMAVPVYQTPVVVHGMMGVIVGFYFKPWQKGNTYEPPQDVPQDNI